jgi:transposase
MINLLTDKEIKDLTTSDPEKAAEYIKLLQGKLSLNSHNSGMPPSLDIFQKKKIKNNRNKTTNSKGGQKGHKGTTIKFDKIDFNVDLKPSFCAKCGASLTGANVADEQLRHVSDFNNNWKLEVTCYKSLSLVCPSCSGISKGVFPDHVNAWAQYGPKIQALITYFSSYQLLPVERLQECLKEIFKVKISQATLLSLVKKTADNLESVLNEIRNLIIDSSVAHFDETSMRTEDGKCWGHVASTSKLTLISAGNTRGLTSMIEAGVLPEFTGTAIHDGMVAYFSDDFDFSHGLCNIHHLRELKFVHEEMSQRWGMRMRSLLMDIKAAVEEAKDRGENRLNDAIMRSYEKKYQNIIDMGLRHPENTKKHKPPGRGRTKQSKSKNLLDRLENKEAVLAFMYNFAVPFDNNLAERDLRMSKVKQKISGCFRGKSGMDTFCKIRSYLGTMRKNSVDILQGLIDAAIGSPFMPVGT